MGRGTSNGGVVRMCLNTVVLVGIGLAIAAFAISLENRQTLEKDVVRKDDALWERDGMVTRSVEDSTEVEIKEGNDPVSYTHLTLPTILRV